MKIQLKRSNDLVDGTAKIPTSSDLDYGELAVNYATIDPAIFLKNSSDEVIKIAGLGGDVSIPGLQQVTDTGSYTTNSISIGGTTQNPTVRIDNTSTSFFASSVAIGTEIATTDLQVTQAEDNNQAGIRISRADELVSFSQYIDANSVLNIGQSNPATEAATPYVSIDTDGKVGIATQTPSAQLEIHATGDNAEILKFETDRPWLFAQRGTDSGASLDLYSTANSKKFTISSTSSSEAGGFEGVAFDFNTDTGSDACNVSINGDLTATNYRIDLLPTLP